LKPTEPKPILQTVQTGGSGTGISYWRELALGCARRAQLRQEEDEQQNRHLSGSLGTGTILHALMAAYYSGKATSVVKIGFTEGTTYDEEARIEAERLFSAYRVEHKPDEFGEVIGVEVDISESPAVEVAVGIAPFTARLDLVVKMDAATCRRLSYLGQLQPGIYIVDHKTTAYMTAASYERYARDLQFIAYQVAYNAMCSPSTCKGLIVNVLTKTKTPEVVRILVPPPTTVDRAILAVVTNQARQKRTSNAPNPDRCFDYNSVCPFLTNGRCFRH